MVPLESILNVFSERLAYNVQERTLKPISKPKGLTPKYYMKLKFSKLTSPQSYIPNIFMWKTRLAIITSLYYIELMNNTPFDIIETSTVPVSPIHLETWTLDLTSFIKEPSKLHLFSIFSTSFEIGDESHLSFVSQVWTKTSFL